MATVVFSERLVETIVSNARLPYDTELSNLLKPTPTPVHHVLDKLLLPEDWKRMNEFQNGSMFFNKINTLVFRCARNGQQITGPEYKSREGFCLPLLPYWNTSDDVRRILGIERVSTVYVDKTYEFTVPNWPQWQPVIGQYVRYAESYSEIVARRTATTDAVRALCKKYRTLAPALREWPSLWSLLPYDAKQRHNERVTRTKKEESEPQTFDTSALADLTIKIAVSKVGG